MNDTLQTALQRLRLSGIAPTPGVRLQQATGNGLTAPIRSSPESHADNRPSASALVDQRALTERSVSFI